MQKKKKGKENGAEDTKQKPYTHQGGGTQDEEHKNQRNDQTANKKEHQRVKIKAEGSAENKTRRVGGGGGGEGNKKRHKTTVKQVNNKQQHATKIKPKKKKLKKQPKT